MSDEWLETNRAWWDERAPIHVGSEFYGLDAFIADPEASHLRPFEPGELGDVTGRTLVHPQCHFGLDTLSWARRGARVTGIDFSRPAVEAATAAAARAGLDAEFLEGNVYDAVAVAGGRTFDVVYTGLGALNWLPDIPRWSRVMADLTAPGGVLYLVEFHPFTGMLGDDDLTVVYPYFQDEALVWDDGDGSYADLDAETEANVTVEWNHGFGEILTGVLDAGFTIELFHEFDYTLFPRWPFLVEDGGIYRLPEGMPSVPLMYSLRARKPR